MSSVPSARAQRFYGAPEGSGARSPFQKDRDRLLYASAFQRLASVTQVVSASEGYVFHNRLTHTLEVAQIARRLAEKLLLETDRALVEALGGLDPEVVEAAALAHDLGHPPFGHIAEKQLDALAKKHNASDGFEGNAQSFRIVTRGAAHRTDYKGLNLTRATLNAILKYPWTRDRRGLDATGHQSEKYGAYDADQEFFAFAREGAVPAGTKSVEAAIMDHADAIAYSVHDLDDFYRAGLVPLEELASSEGEFGAFLERWKGRGRLSSEEIDAHAEAFQRLLQQLALRRRYSGTWGDRAVIRTWTSTLIGQYVDTVALQEPDESGAVLVRDPDQLREMKFLQALIWDYVILNPRLATQQAGQRRIIDLLFATYLDAVKRRDRGIIPGRFHWELENLPRGGDDLPHALETRLAVDIVSSFTDTQAVIMYRRLLGAEPGSVVEILHR
jgi:dGTPase